MEIIIDDNSRLWEIQKEFHRHFPCLNLEFYGFELTEKKIFAKENLIIDTNKTLGEIRHVHSPGRLSINGRQKISTLEQHFRENFGVNIRVHRKSTDTLKASAVNNWTLSELNKKEEELNEVLKEETNVAAI